MKSLRDIETDVAALARRIDASDRDLPTYGTSEDFARPHIEVAHGSYHYVIVERGIERDRRSSDNYHDLLFWIFRDVTHGLAFGYELQNRVEDQDCRRIAFPKQLELMRKIDPALGERLERDIAEILRRAPYDDEPTKAVNRMRGKSG
ncbi:Imm63 family immunity protein [Bradyrhizobium sp.]|uniref:Imm63 family immunity protein n=1 Tax=Bradyrhizobium sp. TaxID=376 RepID=UPI001D711939|nr:Imm63 family immunity protein [Bradyrhizobium sp.]MBI5322791.1 hypothetical protein [Bradyrhizobium sp.]